MTQYPDFGEDFPKIGEVFPNFRQLFPETGEPFPNFRQAFPNLGGVFPNAPGADLRPSGALQDARAGLLIHETTLRRTVERVSAAGEGLPRAAAGFLDAAEVMGRRWNAALRSRTEQNLTLADLPGMLSI